MTATQIVRRLESLGSDSYRKILLNHGASEPVLGVKVQDLKTIQKTVKKDHPLSLELFETGIYDAQYLAGLVADETRITPKDLRHWLARANCPAISSTAVAWIAAESPHGVALALEWIESNDEDTAQTGWTTLGCVAGIRDDADLALPVLQRLLGRVERSIHRQPNHVRYAMNGFVIAVGTYVPDLTAAAIQTGERVGRVSVDMGDTACQVPFAPEYIRKARSRNAVGKKRKTARC